MKHNLKIISIIVVLFLTAQIMGLIITNHYLQKNELPFNLESPEVENKNLSFIPIFIFILIATGIGLLLMKYKFDRAWQFLFLGSTFFALMISFSVFLYDKIALVLALAFALLKVYNRNPLIHNFTEIFVYGGLAAIFVPDILNTFSVIVLLIIISIYDYIAVRKTKHMVKLAKFEGKNKFFAGLIIPYKKSLAILGGGDIGIPLLFAGVVMKDMALPLLSVKTFLIPIFAATALAYLFLKGKSKEYYPAMPYLTVGSLIGFLLVLLI